MEETETITGETKPRAKHKAKLQTIKELGNLEHRRTRSLSPRSVARAVNQPVMDPARVKVSSGTQICYDIIVEVEGSSSDVLPTCTYRSPKENRCSKEGEGTEAE